MRALPMTSPRSKGIEHGKIDLWANALCGAIGFATKDQAGRIFNFFKTREADIFYEGQAGKS